jgi:hypothetical protein
MPQDPDTAMLDALAEILADRVIEMVSRSHPGGDRVFRRRVARFYLRQLTGRTSPPGQISTQEIASGLGISYNRASQLTTNGLLKTKDALERHGLGFRQLLAHISKP